MVYATVDDASLDESDDVIESDGSRLVTSVRYCEADVSNVLCCANAGSDVVSAIVLTKGDNVRDRKLAAVGFCCSLSSRKIASRRLSAFGKSSPI